MQCRQCGRQLRDDESVCPRCGADQVPVGSAQPSPRVPVAVYAPSPQGPPVARGIGELPAGLPVHHMPTDETAPIHHRGYHPVVLPSMPLRGGSRRAPLGRSALAVLALFAVLGLAAGLVARQGNVPIPGLAAVGAHPTATVTPIPACSPAPVAHVAAPPLGSLQLTTGLKNRAQHDYRPVNAVTRFAPGTQGYVTFQVLSSHAGVADVLVCTPGRRLNGSVQVPKGSAGQYVEFPLSLGTADVGQGMVIISWDGSVVANQGFTVAR